ncbi:MAG: DUF4397 domain-containing protein [Anaerolineae bacterium]|nr:DUF4397 domain-containing protein [Anaerolineae bacterium]
MVSRPAEAQVQFPATGFLRVTNASVSFEAVDVYLDGQLFAAGLAFGKASPLTAVAPGEHTIGVREAGGVSGNEFLTATVAATRGNVGEAVILGQRGQTGQQGLRLGFYPLSLQPTDGQARIYVIHASPDAPAVDVRSGETVLAPNLAYTEGTLAPVQVDAGQYPLVLTAAGSPDPLLDLGTAEFKADTIYTAIALGTADSLRVLGLGAAPVTGLIAEPQGSGFVRITHASPGAPNVDVYVNGGATPAVADLAFGASTDMLALPAGALDVALRPAGAPATDEPVFTTSLDLGLGKTYEAIATGVLGGEPAFTIQVVELDRARTAGKARVYYVHAAPTAPSVELRESGETVLSDFAYGAVAGPMDMEPGVYNPLFLISGQRESVAALSQFEFMPDVIYTVVVYGDPVVFTPLVLESAQGGGAGLARIVHAAAGAPAVDLYVNGAMTPAIENLAYRDNTGYIPVNAGPMDVQVRAAGAPFFQVPAFSKRVTVPAGAARDIFALGVLGGDPAFDLRPIPIDRTDLNGNARIYFVHALPGVGAVDVYFNGELAVERMQFGTYTQVPWEGPYGFYNLTVTKAGQRSPVLAGLGQAELFGDTVYVVAAVSDVDPLLVLEDAAPGHVRITHAVAGAPNVDVYLDGAATPAVTDLAFGASTGLVELAAGDHTVDIRATGAAATDAPVFSGTVTVPAGATAEVVAQGLLEGEPAFSLGVYPIDRRGLDGNARLYLIHASPTAPAVEIRSAGEVIVPELAYGNIAGPLDVPAGNYNPLALAPGQREASFALSDFEFLADTVYTIIAYGDPVVFTPIVLEAPAE